MAQTLDELDRQLAAAQAAEGAEGQPTPSASALQSLAQAAQAQQQAMAQARAQAQQQAMAALGEGHDSQGDPPATGAEEAFTLKTVDRTQKSDWGALRKKAAEGVTRSEAASVSSEYRRSVEAYFRVIAERSRQKK